LKFCFQVFVACWIVGSMPDQSFGQQTFQPKRVDTEWKGIIYRSEQTGLVSLLNNGYSIGYRSGKIKTYYKSTYYHLEASIVHDIREQKQNRNIPLSFSKISQSFRFGKQNHVYVLRAGKGVKRLITDKARRRGVAIGYTYEAGPSLAILRPYYLELIYNIEENGKYYNELRVEKYSEENAQKFLDYNSIFGGAPGNPGWGEIRIVPGIQAKLGAFFSSGAFEKLARSLEIGIMADLYMRKIPVMVETESISNKPYFLNFYASLEFGKRSN